MPKIVVGNGHDVGMIWTCLAWLYHWWRFTYSHHGYTTFKKTSIKGYYTQALSEINYLKSKHQSLSKMPLFSFGSSGKSSHKYHCRVLLLDDSEITHEISVSFKAPTNKCVYLHLNAQFILYYNQRYLSGIKITQKILSWFETAKGFSCISTNQRAW